MRMRELTGCANTGAKTVSLADETYSSGHQGVELFVLSANCNIIAVLLSMWASFIMERNQSGRKKKMASCE